MHGIHRLRGHRWLVLALGLLACLLGAAAAQASPDLGQMHHTAWRVRDGAPGPVLALAQTPDGWLWLGTATGLFRFDGNRFERVESLGASRLASPAIRSLAVDRQGALWIGFLYGGIGRWFDHRFTLYGEPQGLPPNTVVRIGFGPDGRPWAAAVRGLYRLQGERWQAVGSHDMAVGVAFDKAGNLWLDAGQQLLRWDHGLWETGAPRAVGKTLYDDAASLQQGPDGAMWQVDSTGPPRRYGVNGDALPGPAVPGERVEPLMFDRDGNAWFADRAELHCVAVADWLSLAAGNKLPQGRSVQELSGMVNVMLQDHEGSIWLGTQGGLDRLRPNKVTALPALQQAPPFALAPGADGSLWVGTSMLGLLRLDRAGGWHSVVQDLPGNVDALARAQDGNLWFGTGDGQLWRVSGAAARRVRAPEAVEGKLPVQSLAVDARGSLWLAGGAVFRREADGRWKPVDQRQGLPAGPPLLVAPGDAGGVWVGYANDRLAEIGADGRVRLYGPDSGLNVGSVTAVQARGDRVWIGGSNGVQLLRGGQLRALLGREGALSHGVAGILERTDGDLWLHGADGVVRVPAAEVQRFLASPDHRPEFERFDHLDGVPGPPEQVHPLPSMVETGDGRLWFAATDALSWIDPRNIHRNRLAPAVEVLGLQAGDQRMPAQDGLALPQRTTRLAIEYTALSLAKPERLRFRYRLEGVDADWQDVGNQRTAYYNNLGPGEYRFQVAAANEDGQWSPQGAALAFRIEPAYYQTWAFRAACALAVAGVLLLAYRLRERRLALRAMERLRIRQLERERIAADLHDTLLQGIHGLLLRMDGVLRNLREPAARESMQAAVELAERLVEEGRDRVSGLRGEAEGVGDIAQALKKAALHLERERHVPVRFTVEGWPELLPPDTQEQLYLVAREAMRNAALHSRGSRLEVRLRYEGETVQLEVADDGEGIPAAVLDSGGREGHWGLQGMRERTQWMQGQIEIVSSPGAGTTVRVRVPVHRQDAMA